MTNRKRLLGVLLLVSAFLAMGFKDPYMQSGKTQLQKAQAQLLVTKKDDAGCRDRALGWVFAAIREVDAGMKASHHSMTDVSSSPAPFSTSSQLRKTLGYLNQAKENLGAAREDAAGHRNKAIQLTDKAIAEVEKALAALGD